jgi:lipoate-protein ligase B
MHGFALNVNADLGYLIISFHVNSGKAVTSLNVELGVEKSQRGRVKRILKHFTELFALKLNASREE